MPKWPFLIADAGLLGAAGLIAADSAAPLSAGATFAIVVCVICAAIAGTIPFLSEYARKQDAALDERQNALEGLSRTVTASAEQISIAAHGLHEIAGLAEKNLRQAAATVPPKAMVEAPAVIDTHSLDAAVDKIVKIAADWTRLFASTQKQLAAAQAQALVAASAAKRDEAKDQPVAPPKAENPGETEIPVPAEPAAPVAPAEIGGTTSASSAFVDEAARLVPPDNAASRRVHANPDDSEVVPPVEAKKPPRKRSPKKNLPPSPETKAPLEEAGLGLSAEALAKEDGLARPFASDDQATGNEPQISAERTVGRDRPTLPSTSEFSQISPEEASPSASLSADGATRLTVTAYIGIGNRLFIRGDGPGLSWDKGVPLQFVSIGKWRWESNDAAAPIKFRLYKNDEVECAALGTRTIEPGQQQEATATF